MKRGSKSIVLVVITIILLNALPYQASAQPGDPGDPTEDPDAPIDGGLSLLLAAGVGYGIKKANDLRSKNKGSIDN